MSRIDKYEPLTGGHRAPLAAAWSGADLSKVIPVSLDANGKVVKAALGNTGYIGVVVVTRAMNAGDIVDVMQDGDIVEFTPAVAATAGTNYYVDAADGVIKAGTGAQTSTAPVTAGSKKVGYTVEATRLVVRISRS